MAKLGRFIIKYEGNKYKRLIIVIVYSQEGNAPWRRAETSSATYNKL